jgi:hypothetical protein
MKCAKNYFLVFVFALSMSSFACRLFFSPDPEPTPEPFWQTIRPELIFTPDILPDAEAGVPYEVTIQISQNETPVGDFQILDGGLPNGLTYEFEEGEDRAKVSGVPEESGTYKFKVSVWCYGTNVSGQMGEKEYTLVVR